MSYQRWNEGDAYVIGTGGDENLIPVFWCVGCGDGPKDSYFLTYQEIILHLQIIHKNSRLAIDRLKREADVIGYDKNWKTYIDYEKSSALMAQERKENQNDTP